VYQVNENALKVRLFRARQRVLRVFEGSSAAAPASEPGKTKA
jgi:hypothetical protein